MSERVLTEKDWRTFGARFPDLRPEPLAKALAALDKSAAAAARLAALDEVDKQAALLRKAHKSADKALLERIDEIAKAALKLRKEAERAADEEEDEAPSALLDPRKLLAQLNLCRRDPARRVQFGFVDGEPASLALSPKLAGRRLFAQLQEARGLKTGAYGTAWVDGTSLMLLPDKPLGGLAKKVRAPVKACGFRIARAVLCSEDGAVVEQDDSAEDAEEATELGGGAAAAADPLGERLAALGARVQDALRAQHPEAGKLRAVAEFAREKIAQGNAKGAQAALDSLEALLRPAAPAAPAAARGPSKIDYAKCRLVWDATRRKVQGDLQKLEQAILTEYRAARGLAQIKTRLRRLDEVLAGFNEDLGLLLDRADTEADADARQRCHREAAALIAKFLARANDDPFIGQLEANPFLPLPLRATLAGPLGTLAKLIR